MSLQNEDIEQNTLILRYVCWLIFQCQIKNLKSTPCTWEVFSCESQHSSAVIDVQISLPMSELNYDLAKINKQKALYVRVTIIPTISSVPINSLFLWNSKEKILLLYCFHSKTALLIQPLKFTFLKRFESFNWNAPFLRLKKQGCFTSIQLWSQGP